MLTCFELIKDGALRPVIPMTFLGEPCDRVADGGQFGNPAINVGNML